MEFEKLLVAIFGQDFIDTFKTHRPAGYVDLMIAFESRKRAATPHKTNPLNVSLPFSFIDYYKKYKVRRYHDIVLTMVTVVCFDMVHLRELRAKVYLTDKRNSLLEVTNGGSWNS